MHDYSDTPTETIAHFSPEEIEVLTAIQGGHHADERTGLPSFAPLLKLLDHPEAHKLIHTLNEFKPKEEGIGKLIADSGRFGDSKAAVLPRPIADLFDAIMNNGKPSINPTTGKREYWGLSDLFGGIKNIVSSVAPTIGGLVSNAAPAIGNFAREGISKLGGMAGMQDLGNSWGNSIGNAASQIAANGGAALQNGNFDPASFLKNSAGIIGNALAPNISEGIKSLAPMAGDAAQAGLTALGDRFGVPPEVTGSMGGLINQGVSSLANMGGNVVGDLVRHLSNNLSTGTAPSEGIGAKALTSSGNEILNNYGTTPMGAATGTGLTSAGAGYSPQQSMLSGAQAGINQMQNPIARTVAQGGLNTYNNLQNGYTPMNAVKSGLGAIDPGIRTEAQNQGLGILRNMGRRAFNRRASV